MGAMDTVTSNQGQIVILQRRGEGALAKLCTSAGRKAEMWKCAISVLTTTVSACLREQCGKSHKMEDLESQTSELNFGVPCVGKVKGIRKMEKKRSKQVL